MSNPRTGWMVALSLCAVTSRVAAQRRHRDAPASAPTSVTSITPSTAAPSADAADESARETPSFALRLDRGHGPEYPRAEYSRATVHVVPVLDHNRPAFQVYGRARFYTLDGEYHDFSCSLTVYPDGTTPSARDYPCRDSSPMIDLANVSGIEIVSLTEHHVEFRIASATMITSHHVYRDIVFRLENADGTLLVPPRDYRP